MSLARAEVALGILAGGQARRLGGIDKALAPFEGSSLAARTFAAVGGDFYDAMISYNGDAALELPAGLRPVADRRPGFHGPLAGIESLLESCSAPWLLTLPVDLVQIPDRLFERLGRAVVAEIGARARDAEGEQPLVALWPVTRSRTVVAAALEDGELAVHRVQALLGFTACDFSPWRFGNLNSPADFAHAR